MLLISHTSFSMSQSITVTFNLPSHGRVFLVSRVFGVTVQSLPDTPWDCLQNGLPKRPGVVVLGVNVGIYMAVPWRVWHWMSTDPTGWCRPTCSSEQELREAFDDQRDVPVSFETWRRRERDAKAFLGTHGTITQKRRDGHRMEATNSLFFVCLNKETPWSCLDWSISRTEPRWGRSPLL